MAAEDDGASLNWGAHEDEIHSLFITQNKTLREVAAEMTKKHGFTARYIIPHTTTAKARRSKLGSMLTTCSERQYKYRFQGLKNVKEDEWVFIEEETRKRDALGKPSVWCLHGKPLPQDRINRGTARVRAVKSGVTKKLSQSECR